MQVWVTGRAEAEREVAERLGEDPTFRRGPAAGDGGRGVETDGEATWADSMRGLKRGGAIVVSGSTSGPNPGRTCSDCSSSSCG